jgi:hypothetical protein
MIAASVRGFMVKHLRVPSVVCVAHFGKHWSIVLKSEVESKDGWTDGCTERYGFITEFQTKNHSEFSG